MSWPGLGRLVSVRDDTAMGGARGTLGECGQGLARAIAACEGRGKPALGGRQSPARGGCLCYRLSVASTTVPSSRQRLCSLLDRVGLIEGVLRMRARFGSPYLTVLTYHRVFDVPNNYPFDRGVIDVGPEAFDAQLKTLGKYFNVVGTEEVCAHFEGVERLPPNAAVVSFDDGYLDNLQVAAPILKDNGMRGVFFIATSYIEERRMYWWDRINYLFHHASPGLETVTLEYPARIVLDVAAGRSQALATILHLMKIQFDLDVERMLDGLATALGVSWNRELERELCEGFVMTWDDVRALADMGMDVQSHTRSHRALQTVPYAELAQELAGAKQDLERELGRPVDSISYPIGRSIATLDPIRQALKDAGYKVGYTNASGAQPLWGESDRYDVRRIAIEPEYRGSFCRGVLAVPQLGY